MMAPSKTTLPLTRGSSHNNDNNANNNGAVHDADCRYEHGHGVVDRDDDDDKDKDSDEEARKHVVAPSQKTNNMANMTDATEEEEDELPAGVLREINVTNQPDVLSLDTPRTTITLSRKCALSIIAVFVAVIGIAVVTGAVLLLGPRIGGSRSSNEISGTTDRPVYEVIEKDVWESSDRHAGCDGTRDPGGPSRIVRSVSFSKDGSTVALGTVPKETIPSSSEDGFDGKGPVQICRVGRDGPATEYLDPSSLSDEWKYAGGALALSRNGTRLAVALASGSVLVFDWSNEGEGPQVVGNGPVRMAGPPSEAVAAIALSADGDIMAIASSPSAAAVAAAIASPTLGATVASVRLFRLVADKEEQTTNTGRMWRPMKMEEEEDVSGKILDISLASDGRTLAVSATHYHDDDRTSAEVRVLAFNGTSDAWEQVGDVLSGDEKSERFGFSMSLSPDGSVLAVGDPWYDGGRGRVQFWATQGSKMPMTMARSKRRDDHGNHDDIVYEPFDGRINLEGHHEGDRFGYDVDLSDDGKTCVIGIPMVAVEEEEDEEDEEANGSDRARGRVAVFRHRDCGSWAQKGLQVWGDSEVPYGRKVAISGDGAQFVTDGQDLGQLRFYEVEDRHAWEQIGETLMGSVSFEALGYAIALAMNGTMLAIGAGLSDEGHDDSGYVETYRLDEGQRKWVQIGQRLVGANESALLGVGLDMSVDGSTLIAGESRGKVKVFSHQNDSWKSSEILQIPSEHDERSKVSTSVAMSDDGLSLAAGVMTSGIGENGRRKGAVVIYSRTTKSSPNWSESGFIPGRKPGDGLGSSIAMSGDGSTVAAAYGISEEYIETSGSVRVFNRNKDTGEWQQVGPDLHGFALRGPYSFLRLALNSDGTVLAVGEYILNIGRADNNGTVTVYRLSSDKSEWEAAGDPMVGVSAALQDTSDGLLLAVGVPFHDFGFEGHCLNRGLIRVFRWQEEADPSTTTTTTTSGSWQQIGDDIVGREELDTLGTSVAISKNGKVVAGGGALSAQGGVLYSGIIQVFRLVSPDN